MRCPWEIREPLSSHKAPVDYERCGFPPHVCSSSKVSLFSLGSDPLDSGEGCRSASLSVFPPCSLRESSRWVPSIHQGFTDFLVGLSVDALIMETLVAGGPRDCPMRSPWAGWGRRRRGVDVGLVGPSVDGLRAGRGATPWAPGARP